MLEWGQNLCVHGDEFQLHNFCDRAQTLTKQNKNKDTDITDNILRKYITLTSKVELSLSPCRSAFGPPVFSLKGVKLWKTLPTKTKLVTAVARHNNQRQLDTAQR